MNGMPNAKRMLLFQTHSVNLAHQLVAQEDPIAEVIGEIVALRAKPYTPLAAIQVFNLEMVLATPAAQKENAKQSLLTSMEK
jgi:hypothetical protein